MALTGYSKKCKKRSGGIRSLCVIRSGDVAGVERDSDGRVTEVTLVEGARWTQYDFVEGSARYTNSATPKSGTPVLTHEVSFTLPCMDLASLEALDSLSEAGGLLVLAVDEQGTGFLVGYSIALGLEKPLRLTKSVVCSGEKGGGYSYVEISLRSQDVSLPLQYAGPEIIT